MKPFSHSSNHHQSGPIWKLMGLTASGIFIADVFLPLGVAAGVPYILVILLSLRQRDPRVPFWTAVGCSTLTILGIALSPPGGDIWKIMVNRGLILLAIWTTTLMGRHQLQPTKPLYVREHFFQDFMETIPVACFSFDRQGTILSWNTAAERIYGYSKKEAVGASSYDLMVTPEAFEKTKTVIATIFQGKTFESMIWHDRNKKGELGWRTGNLFPVFDTQGHVSYGININIDISAQKRAESELLTKNALFEAILNSSTDAIFAKDQEGKYLFVNQAAAEIIGQPPKAIIGFDNTQLFNPEIAKSVRAFDSRIFSNTQSIPFEATLSVEGVPKVYSNIPSPLLDTNGKTMGLVGISREITEQKQTQKDLLLTDRVFMASPDHISILGRDYRYRRVNGTYERVHQKFSNEIVGMSVSDLLGKEVFEQTIKPMLDRCFLGEEVHYETWMTFANDQRRYMAVSYLPLSQEDQDIQEIVVIGRDWTERKKIEEALYTSEQQLRTILDSMICFVGIWSPDGKFTDCNQFSLQAAGLQRSDVIGKHIADTYWINHSPENQRQIRALFDRVAQGEIVREDVKVRINDQTYLTVDACHVPIRDENGAIVQLVASGIDVTARRQAEQALEDNQRKLQAIMDHSPNLIFMKDLEGRYLRINKQFEHVFQVSETNVIGATDQEVFPLEQAIQFQSHDRLVLQAQAPLEVEETAVHNDGIHTSLVQKFPLHDQSGAIYAIGGITTDITQRKQIETELRASEYRYRSLIETAGSIIIGLTADGWIVEWNLEAEHLFGKTREEVLDQNYFDCFIQESQRSEIMTDIQTVLAGASMRDFQHPVIGNGGQLRQISWNVDRLIDENQQPYGMICIGRDITEWNKAQAQLQKWAAIYQHTQWGVAVGEANSQTLDMVNEAYARMHGYSVEELQGEPIAQVFAPAFRSQLPEIIQIIHEQGFHSFESLHIRKDGTTFPALVTVSAVKDHDGVALYRVANVIDISKIKQAELALQESKQIYQDLVQTVDGVVWECDFPSNQFTFVSQCAEKLLGYPKEQWCSDPSFFPNFLHEDDRQWVFDFCRESTLRKESHAMEYRVYHANGDIRWVRDQVTVVVKNDQPVKLRGIMMDITERKRLEKVTHQQNEALELEVERRAERIQELEQRRMQVEKLAALAQVAAGVAHEINNPLASISQSLILLKRAIPTTHPHFRYFAKVEDCIDRMAQITKHLYQLYRPSSPTPTANDLRLPIQSAVEIMHSRASKNQVSISLVDLPTPLLALVPKGELTQVMCNLLQNAIDVSQPQSTIEVNLDSTLDIATIRVIDHGLGISPAVASHIFEPFFTTKQGQADGGMGLGLSISHSLVKAMGGKLDFSTSIGQGSTFTISLPLT